MIGQINPPQTQNTNPYFFKDLETLNFTQTSLFLVNYINLFKSIVNNSCTLTYLHSQNFVNAYLHNSDVNFNYKNNVIYLVFNKEGTYKPCIKVNNNYLTILELLEEKPETLDFYEDNFNYVYAFKPSDENFKNYIYLIKKGLYLELPKLYSKTIISNFINNLIDKKGLYEIIQNELDLEYIPHPFLKINKLSETYSENNFKKIQYKDFIALKKYT